MSEAYSDPLSPRSPSQQTAVPKQHAGTQTD
jgi:hypothetical protein